MDYPMGDLREDPKDYPIGDPSENHPLLVALYVRGRYILLRRRCSSPGQDKLGPWLD